MNAGPGQGPYVEAVESANILSLRDLIRVLRNRIFTIALTVLVCVGVFVGVCFLQTPQYEASINILVGQASGIADSPSYATGLEDMTQTIAHAVLTRPVAEEVIRRQDLDVTPQELLDTRLNATQATGTQFVRVAYTDTDPRRAQLVADTVGEVFVERMREISPDASAVTATVWERAAVPEGPFSPNPRSNAALGLVAGLLLGVGLAFLREYFDDSWRSAEEAEEVSGVPTFGAIPRFEAPRRKKKARNKSQKKGKQDVPA